MIRALSKLFCNMGSTDQEGREMTPSEDRGPLLNKSRREAEKHYVYFWRVDGQYGEFSQWYPTGFKIEGQEFNCAEQYMMYTKAVLMHDDDQAAKILQCRHPAKMKSLGRGTKQFHEEFWKQQCLHVVKAGNKAKFSQNHSLKQQLYATYPQILVEASPYDRTWGIGLGIKEQAAWNEATWDGMNLLGFILTEVRDELMFEEGIILETDKKIYFEKLMEEMRLNHDKYSPYDRVQEYTDTADEEYRASETEKINNVPQECKRPNGPTAGSRSETNHNIANQDADLSTERIDGLHDKTDSEANQPEKEGQHRKVFLPTDGNFETEDEKRAFLTEFKPYT